MGKGEPCEICGGTESNLVDGFYYCTECGTQDTNVRETLVEQTLLADGTFGIARRQKISKKLKEGVKMSKEWYKWHTVNFILAGLTEQLVQLGAAPSLKMKVLWIWTRYIKKFQKKDEMRQTQMFSQLQVSSESESEKSAGSARERGSGSGARSQPARAPLRRPTRVLLAALLVLALNLDRSALQLSHFVRLVLYRLLDINDFRRFVPAEIRARDLAGCDMLFNVPLSSCTKLPGMMSRVVRHLELGPPLTPDVEGVLRDQLRDLGLPPGLGRLALALMDRAPIPFRNEVHFEVFEPATRRYPDYEVVVMAYVLVALKMCFGLDDERERRLSAAVDGINASDGRLRAYADVPGDTDRLFSPREWLAHLQFRRAALGAHYAPLAWERNVRADEYVFIEHFEDYAYAGGDGRGRDAPCPVSDRLTMDILDRIPAGAAPDVVPLHALRPCMAARTPHAALAAVVAAHARDARTRLRLGEDFARYSAEYAYRTLALPGAAPDLFEGVAEAGKTLPEGPDRKYTASRSDPTIVHVRNCENKNWFKTRRPTAYHVVGADEPADEGGAADERGAEDEDRKVETFEEEAEGVSVFDDDFRDVHVKQEIKIDCDPESFHVTEDDLESHVDYFRNFDSFHENVDGDRRAASDVGARGGLAFDSDEEGPRYDPATFDRHETIKKIMIEAYREMKVRDLPVRFAPDGYKPKTGARKKRAPGDVAAPQPSRRRPFDAARAAARHHNRERVQELMVAYFHNLRHDVLHQVAQQVKAFVDNVEDHQAMRSDDAASNRDPAEPAHPADEARDVSSSDTRDVEVIEDNLNATDDDDGGAAGPAEDPVYRGDARFDEREHDTRQLYVKLKEDPRVERAPADDGDDDDDDVSELLDEKIAEAGPRRRRAGTTRRPRGSSPNVDRLVDDPKSITRFNYWFTHYSHDFKKSITDSDAVQASLDETLPRAFRAVLREAAAGLQARPALLYRRLSEVEAALFLRPPDRGPRARGRPPARGPRARGRPPARPKKTAPRKSPYSKENFTDVADAEDGPPDSSKRNKRARKIASRSKENLTDEADAEDGPPGDRKRKKRAPQNSDDLKDVGDGVSSAIMFF